MTQVKASGWRLLIKPREAPDKQGSIILADVTKDQTKFAAVVCQVMEIGPDAWKGDRFNGPWCKVGDWILIAKFGGLRFKIGKDEYRIINDDEVLAVVEDPNNILPA